MEREMIEQIENKPRHFVWTSKGAPREKQTLSLLALGETLGATAFVWGWALYFDYFGWLLISILFGPLLLLRSPQSMAIGIRWYQKDLVGLKNYKQWSLLKRMTLIVIMSYVTVLIIFLPSQLLAEFMLAEQSGWMLELLSVGYGVIVFVLSVAVAGAGTVAVIGAVVGVGLSVRAVLMRLGATLFHWFLGFKQLPHNWWENCFVVDAIEPPTLMPVDQHCSEMVGLNTWEGLKPKTDDILSLKVTKWFIGAVWFIPAYLYRLNIKSTFWFYWPLVLLLNPISSNKANTPKTQILYSISNIGILLLNLVPVVWLVYFIVMQVGLISAWEAVPVYAQYLLVLNWTQLDYWDYIHITVAGLTLAILALSCHAHAYYKHDNVFHKLYKWALPATILLYRIRNLAIIAGLLLGVGSIFIHMANEPAILEWLPRWLEPYLQEGFVLLRSFYHV